MPCSQGVGIHCRDTLFGSLAEGMMEAVSSGRDCLQAGESCTNDPSCSSKFRTLRQCIAGNGANKLGPDAKNQCRSTVTALLSSQLYGCKCKRGMKKEKHCLSVYWSIHHTLMEGQSAPRHKGKEFPLLFLERISVMVGSTSSPAL